MIINGNNITFEADEKAINSLKLALSILDTDGDTAFRDFIRQLSLIALRRNSFGGFKDEVNNHFITYTNRIDEPLDNQVVRSRIARWARSSIGTPHRLIKAFFEIYDKSESHIVKRDDLENVYNSCSPDIPEGMQHFRFLTNFRMACSNSRKAYGLIFKYNNNEGEGEVVLHPLNADYILSLKDEFLK